MDNMEIIFSFAFRFTTEQQATVEKYYYNTFSFFTFSKHMLRLWQDQRPKGWFSLREGGKRGGEEPSATSTISWTHLAASFQPSTDYLPESFYNINLHSSSFCLSIRHFSASMTSHLLAVYSLSASQHYTLFWRKSIFVSPCKSRQTNEEDLFN